MALSAIRKAPLAALLMLGCALPAHAGWFSSDPKPAAQTNAKSAMEQPAAATLDESIRQAQMLRLAAQYPEAIKHLSQLMMVASDDERVVAEYGKTLASMGRASDAVNFLTRAQQLQPGDWTIYSAMGVAYDQIGDQKNAQAAYEQALKIKPDEPSVLNNYALSRMLAKDPEMARKLVARAESAGGSNDAKIARNIEMIRSLAPETPVAAANPAPAAATASVASAAHTPVAPVTAAKPQVTQASLPPAENKVVMQRVPMDPLAGPVQKPATPVPVAKATLAPPAKPAETNPAPAIAAAKIPQPVPAKAAEVSPAAKVPQSAPVKAAEVKQAAPANPTSTATAAPRPLQPATVAASVAKAPQAKPATPAASPVPQAPVKAAETAKTAPVIAVTPVKTADTKPVPVTDAAKPIAKASAPVKPGETKPEPVKAAEAAKPAPAKAPGTAAAPAPAPVKVAAPTPSPAKTAEAEKPSASVSLNMAPVKPADTGKTAAAPKVLPVKSTDAKTAETKPKTKETIPGLRMSANAY